MGLESNYFRFLFMLESRKTYKLYFLNVYTLYFYFLVYFMKQLKVKIVFFNCLTSSHASGFSHIILSFLFKIDFGAFE